MMNDQRILVDTNSYLKIARVCSPLLGDAFGEPSTTLLVLPHMGRELMASKRLQTKFPWLSDPLFARERESFPKISRQDTRRIAMTQEFLMDKVIRERLKPSRVDVAHIAHALVLGMALATDDQNMAKFAAQHEAESMGTLDLMRLMLDRGRIDMDHVRLAAKQWQADNDLPTRIDRLRKEYSRIFREPLPVA